MKNSLLARLMQLNELSRNGMKNPSFSCPVQVLGQSDRSERAGFMSRLRRHWSVRRFNPMKTFWIVSPSEG